MNGHVHIGDSIRISRLKIASKKDCNWSDDFDCVFKVIGFAKDFSTQGFNNHWKDVSNNYEYVDLFNISSTPMSDIPHFILDRKLSDGSDIIHPIFVTKDEKSSRTNKINKLLK